MTAKPATHTNVKDIYRNSAHRIGHVLEKFGQPKADSKLELHSDRDYESFFGLINSVIGSQSFEVENDYRTAIQNVGHWILGAYQKDFLLSNSATGPNPLYVVKRALEVLHMLLHRDLRRKQLSPTENQVYHEFQSLAAALPNPCKKRLNQSDVDSFLDNALSRKTS